MDKENVVWYLYTMEFYAAMKKFHPFTTIYLGVNGWNWRTSF
jgi:hypothetical protein